VQDFLLLVLVVHDFQEQHPSQLLDALAIAGEATVFPHDVSDGFD